MSCPRWSFDRRKVKFWFCHALFHKNLTVKKSILPGRIFLPFYLLKIKILVHQTKSKMNSFFCDWSNLQTSDTKWLFSCSFSPLVSFHFNAIIKWFFFSTKWTPLGSVPSHKTWKIRDKTVKFSTDTQKNLKNHLMKWNILKSW